MYGKLVLIPGPIHESGQLMANAKDVLLNAWKNKRDTSIFLVEDLRPGRRRWLHFGLPREAIECFRCYNEHNKLDEIDSIINELKDGKNIYLMSDAGLPAFCDPGQELVNACHENKISVTSTPFCNSTVLALALSGFKHDEFLFKGFLSQKNPARSDEIKLILKEKRTVIVMDTPYRLSRILREFKEFDKAKLNKNYFLAMDLNSNEELCLRGPIDKLIKSLPSKVKREFVLIISDHIGLNNP